MLFFYNKKRYLVIVCLLLLFSSSIYSQAAISANFSEKTQDKSVSFQLDETKRIDDLKRSISTTKARLQVYKILSVLFLSTLIFCLFYIYKKGKRNQISLVYLNNQLKVETKTHNLLEQHFLIIERFENGFYSKLETIINSIRALKKCLNKNQEELSKEIDVISEFVELSANNYNKINVLINAMK